MPRYKKDESKSIKDEREMAILAYLDENRGGRDANTIMKALSLGGIDVIRRALAVLEMDRCVNVVNGSYKYAHGGNRTKWFHITPEGVDRLYELRGDVSGRDDDWSSVPALVETPVMPAPESGPTAPGPIAVPAGPTPAPGPTEAEPSPEEAREERPMDIDALGKALDALRALNVGVDDIDFDIGALTAKVEGRIHSSVMPCPHCGGEMAWQSVGDNRMLVCKGCCLAVTWKKNPKDMTGLVRAWNRRV